jgi:NADPH:quinone reductase-like Zn-dependent oxidoreductase
MKAAVINQLGDIPKYEDFPDPVLKDGDVTVMVKAVILDYAVKALTAGIHFASKQFYPSLPAVVGYSGIGSLEDGTLVSFRGVQPPYGAMTEKVAIPKANTTPIPPGITAEQAAVIPSAALSSLGPLKYVAKLQLGETVLINGATSVSGMLAVQIAKYLGAGRVVGTGRNPESGEKLRASGADAFINLNQPDEKVVEAIKKEAGKGYDVILDYLWGHPAEVIINSFTPTELRLPGRRTRFVLIGGLAGQTAQISGQSLLTSGLEIYGMMAQTPPEARAEGIQLVWDLIKQGKISMDIVKYPLKDIEKAWELDEHGKRIVMIP